MITYWFNENTVSRLLEQRAADTPNGVAFQREAEDGSWQPTLWHEFAARVDTLARAMYASGLRKGDRLALIAPVSLEWELLHHAALAMGVVVVGLDAHDLPERLAVMIEQADITAFAASDARVLSQASDSRLNRCHVLLALGWVADTRQALRGWRTWEAFESAATITELRPDAPTADDTATIIFTSGTTGAPKGIAYRNGQVCLAIEAIRDAFGFVGSDGRLLCWLPLSNLFQRMVSLVGLRQGAATYLLADPRRVMQVVAHVSPDIFVGVPRFYEKLYDGLCDTLASMPPLQRKLVSLAWAIGRRRSLCIREGRPVHPWLALLHTAAERSILRRLRKVMGTRLQCMVTGSAPLPKKLFEEFHALGWLVLEAYGLSENVLPMTMNRLDGFCFGSVGRPLPGNDIELSDNGTVKVRGPCLSASYLDGTEQLQIDGAGYYDTGDLGRFDAAGYLHLSGRVDDLIKTSTGRRIAPDGAEAQLRTVRGIDQAIMIGSGQKLLVALCSAPGLPQGADSSKSIEETLRLLVTNISEHERPAGIAFIERPFNLESGELTPNLKLKRKSIERNHAALIQRLYAKIATESHSSEIKKLVFIWPE